MGERWGTAWGCLPRCLLQAQPGKCKAAVPCIITYHGDGNPSGKAGDQHRQHAYLPLIKPQCCQLLFRCVRCPLACVVPRWAELPADLRDAERHWPWAAVWGRGTEKQDSVPLPWGLCWCLTPFSKSCKTFQKNHHMGAGCRLSQGYFLLQWILGVFTL